MTAEVLTLNITIVNERGLHARASAKVVELSERFACEAFVFFDGERADPRSIMELLTLAAACGSELRVEASGEDAEEYLAQLAALFAGKFGEGKQARGQVGARRWSGR